MSKEAAMPGTDQLVGNRDDGSLGLDPAEGAQ